VAAVRQQERDTEAFLTAALVEGTLVAEVEGGPPVPRVFWQSSGASTTITTRVLQLDGGAQPEDLQWQHHRVVLKIDKFDKWLNDGSAADTKEPRHRREDVEKDAMLRNKIESVLSAAKRKWPSLEKMPRANQMARLLALDDAVKEIGYKEPAIRKILSGRYTVSKRLKILGYPDINIEKN